MATHAPPGRRAAEPARETPRAGHLAGPATEALAAVDRTLNARPALVAQRALAETLTAARPVQRAPAPRPNRTGLPDRLKHGVEALGGVSLDDVRVHRNSAAPAGLQAHAFAQGSDIHLAPGQEQHLPHEAWHVVQQKQGRVAPTAQLRQGVALNDDPSLEAEADRQGALALHHAAPPAAPLQAKAAGAAPPVQRVLGHGDAEALRWDAICAEVDDWGNAALDLWITTAETAWNAVDRQLTWKTRKVTALKNTVAAAIAADKKDPTECDNLDWDDIIPHLETEFPNTNLITLAVSKNIRLGGRHGRGDYWKATVTATNATIETGTIPASAHGREVGPDGAARAAKTVVTHYNTMLDVIAAAVAQV
jgi:hypothetical protein